MNHPVFEGLTDKIISVHEMLESLGVPHQFGGAIALAWYRNPRATTDIDLNLTIPVDLADPVLGALRTLGVSVTPANRTAIDADGQARLDWQGSYLDLFFATFSLHYEMAEQARHVSLASSIIPILSPEHLVVCKVVFNRPKDWLDIEEMVRWGTTFDVPATLRWVREILGEDSEPFGRASSVLASADMG